MLLFRFITFYCVRIWPISDTNGLEPARGLDPWRWPNGSQPLGTRMLCLACVMVITSLRRPCLSWVVCGTLFPSSSKSNIRLTFVWIPASEDFWKFQRLGLRSWIRKLDVNRNVTASSEQAHSPPSPIFYYLFATQSMCYASCDLYSAANDPRPQMIPRPEMIPKLDRKWSRTADDPRCEPQMIPPNEKWCSITHKHLPRDIFRSFEKVLIRSFKRFQG